MNPSAASCSLAACTLSTLSAAYIFCGCSVGSGVAVGVTVGTGVAVAVAAGSGVRAGSAVGSGVSVGAGCSGSALCSGSGVAASGTGVAAFCSGGTVSSPEAVPDSSSSSSTSSGASGRRSTSAYTGRAIAITRQAVTSSAVSRRAQPVVFFPVLFNLLTRLSRWFNESTLFHRGSLWNNKRSWLLLLAQPLPCCFQKNYASNLLIAHLLFSVKV